jgi:hypothetical protein
MVFVSCRGGSRISGWGGLVRVGAHYGDYCGIDAAVGVKSVRHRRLRPGTYVETRLAGKDRHLMRAATLKISDTRQSLLARVRDLGDARGRDEFVAIYRPLIFG